MLEVLTKETEQAHIDTMHRIYFKNSQKMREVKDDEVHAVITSPPYWNIKDYGNPKQIGYHDSLTK